MYIDLEQNQLNSKLEIKHFSALCEQEQKQVKELFLKEINIEYSHILYKKLNNNFSILGYFIVDNNSITNSKIYEYYRQTSIAITEKDPQNTAQSIACLQICTWVFDLSLKNEDTLKYIFSFITQIIIDQPYILWYEEGNKQESIIVENTLLGNTSAIIYFTQWFLQK